MGSIVKRGTKHAPKFYAQYEDADGVRRTKLLRGAKNREQASVLLASIELSVMSGKVGVVEPTPERTEQASVTVAELSRMFLGQVANEPGYAPPSIKDLKNYRVEQGSIHRVRILPKLGQRVAASVTKGDVERLRDAEIADGRKPNSTIKTLIAFSCLFNWARRAGKIVCPNPCEGVERPRATSSLDYLDLLEVGRLLAAADDLAVFGVATWETITVGPMAATAIYAGLRKGELFGLRWRDVHLTEARIDVMRSYQQLPKSGKPRHLPMHPELVRILRVWKERCPATDEGLVFPIHGGGKKGRWHMGREQDMVALPALFASADCHRPADGKPWHMLRHTFASHAVMSGTSLYDVQQLLGHADPEQTQKYAHLAPDHLASAVARLRFTAPASADVPDLGEERRRRQAGEQA